MLFLDGASVASKSIVRNSDIDFEVSTRAKFSAQMQFMMIFEFSPALLLHYMLERCLNVVILRHVPLLHMQSRNLDAPTASFQTMQEIQTKHLYHLVRLVCSLMVLLLTFK